MRLTEGINLLSPRWRTLFSIRRITFGGENIKTIKMNYTMYMSKKSNLNLPPILTMNGINVTRANWRNSCRKMAKRGTRAVISVEARNHDEGNHTPNHTPKHLAADVADFILKNRLIHIVALGHSLVGRGLMTLALTKPELVERAIFVDITPGIVPKEALDTYKLLTTMVKVLPTIPDELSLREGRKFVLHHFLMLVNSHLELLLITMNLVKHNGKFAWKSNPQAMLDGWKDSVSNYEETLTGLQPYQGKTLLIAAKKSKFCTSSNIKTMKKYFPQLQVEYLDSAHKIHMDQPDKFLEVVVNFSKS